MLVDLSCSGEGVFYPHPLDDSTVLHVFGEEQVGATAEGGLDDQGVPEREPVPHSIHRPNDRLTAKFISIEPPSRRGSGRSSQPVRESIP